jgi:hypothetical protein
MGIARQKRIVNIKIGHCCNNKSAEFIKILEIRM